MYVASIAVALLLLCGVSAVESTEIAEPVSYALVGLYDRASDIPYVSLPDVAPGVHNYTGSFKGFLGEALTTLFFTSQKEGELPKYVAFGEYLVRQIKSFFLKNGFSEPEVLPVSIKLNSGHGIDQLLVPVGHTGACLTDAAAIIIESKSSFDCVFRDDFHSTEAFISGQLTPGQMTREWREGNLNKLVEALKGRVVDAMETITASDMKLDAQSHVLSMGYAFLLSLINGERPYISLLVVTFFPPHETPAGTYNYPLAAYAPDADAVGARALWAGVSSTEFQARRFDFLKSAVAQEIDQNRAQVQYSNLLRAFLSKVSPLSSSPAVLPKRKALPVRRKNGQAPCKRAKVRSVLGSKRDRATGDDGGDRKGSN